MVVPGVTTTDAWGKLAATRGTSKEELVEGIAGRLSPMGAMEPRQLGDAVAFAGSVCHGVEHITPQNGYYSSNIKGV